MAGSFEHGDDPSRYKKCEKFDWLRKYLFVEKDCCMELVISDWVPDYVRNFVKVYREMYLIFYPSSYMFKEAAVINTVPDKHLGMEMLTAAITVLVLCRVS
jgi:hypothetical protein